MRGRISVLILGAVTVLAAGCGTKPVAAGMVSAAVANTAATSSKVSVSVTISGPGMTTTLTSTGEFDYAHRRGVTRMGGGIMPSQEIRYLPPRLYVKVGGDGMPLPAGKSWIEITLPAQAAAAGLIGSPMGGMNLSPADLLSALTVISSKVTDLGPDTIRGVTVTHYRVTVDLAKAAAALPAAERTQFQEFTGLLGVSTLPVDVWVDGQVLVRRVSVALPMPKDQGIPGGFQVMESADYYDFGVPVVVTAPPAAEIMSQADYDKATMGNGSGGVSFSGSGGPGQGTPPPVSGTLTPAQASAAGQAVRAFWTALAGNSVKAVEAAVMPSQRSCVAGFLQGMPVKFKVTSLQITKVTPAGTGKATVWFSVNATVRVGGQTTPVGQGGAVGPDWLLTTEIGGVWYVDLSTGSGTLPSC